MAQQQGGGFTEKSAKRIASAVKWVESQPVDLTGNANRYKGTREIWAKITGGSASGYSWTEQRRTDSGFEAIPGGRSGTTTTNKAISTDDEAEVEPDTIVRLVLNLSEDGESYWTIVSGVRESCGSESPATVDVVTSVTWNVGGNGKLQYKKRTLTIDSCGTVSVSAETTVDVDTAEAC